MALPDDSAVTSSIEITYWEALRSYWRIYWPTQLLSLLAYFPLILLGVRGRVYSLHLSPLGHVLALLVLGCTGLLAYIHRILLPFRGFSIEIIPDPARPISLTPMRRLQLWVYVSSRLIIGLILAVLLLAPTNIVLSLIGLRALLGVGFSSVLTTLSLIFVVGPILMKMLIGHQFSDFRLEVKRF